MKNITTRDLYVRAMAEAKLPGGMVAKSVCGAWTTHDFPLLKPSLQELLDGIVSVEPEYTWEVDDGVVNLFARGEEPVLLQTKIAKFQVIDAESPNLAIGELLALPGLRDQASRELGGQLIQVTGPYSYPMPERKKFSVSVANVTVREAFNAIARANGSGLRIFARNRCANPDRKMFSLNFLEM